MRETTCLRAKPAPSRCLVDPVYHFSARDGIPPWGRGAHPSAQGLKMALLGAAGWSWQWPDSEEEGGTGKAAEKHFAHALRMLEMNSSPPQLFQLLSFFLLLLFLEVFLLTIPHKWWKKLFKGQKWRGKKLSSFIFPSKSECFLKRKNSKKYK